MNEGQQNAIQVIQALEDQMRSLNEKIDSLAGSTLSKGEAEKLHDNLITVHNALVNSFQDVKTNQTDLERESLRLATEASETAIEKEMAGVRDDLNNAAREFANATGQVWDTVWIKRTYMGIGGATLLGLLIVIGSYVLTSRNLNLPSKQEELARLEKAISDNAVIIEKQKLEYEELKNNVSRLNFEANVVARIRESIEYTNAVGGGVEIYLKEGWGTERCELANGSSARKCVRRD